MKPRIYLNPLPQVEGATWVELTQGYYALLDNWLALIAPKFAVKKGKRGNVLYGHHGVKIDGKWTTQTLHRWVFEQYKIDTPHDIDHINRNGLDNRFSNLRPATDSQNKGNEGLRKDNKSNYRGVSWSKEHEKWRVRIMVNSKMIHLGYFDDIVLAVQAYDKAAIKYFGEFASTNFLKSTYIKVIDSGIGP